MSLYEVIKFDGTREKIEGEHGQVYDGCFEVKNQSGYPIVTFAPGTWLEVWRREGVIE